MSPRLSSFFARVATLVLIGGGFFFLVNRTSDDGAIQDISQQKASTSAQTASVAVGAEVPAATASTEPATTTPKRAPAVTIVKPAAKKKPVTKPTVQATATTPPETKQPADSQAMRIKNPYAFPPSSFEALNGIVRPTLVNILCTPRSGGTLSPVSGSGVIIDSRGVILTNAHVAQYVLLSQNPRINLACSVRTGAPATPRWKAEILYLPPVWVETHAREILLPHPVGTGEHDYALLRITANSDGTPVSDPLPYLPVDTREAIGFQGDSVLAVSYPAEFLASAAQFNMYPASSITTIKELLTFFTRSVDLLSLGGIVAAQGGSSGGPVVNAWGRLIAILSTTSEGETTAMRDLRAVTLSYINRDLVAQTQFDLPTILAGDLAMQASDFNTRIAPKLIELYLAQISK